MCKGISSEAIKVNHFSYRDTHGRKVILSDKIADKTGSYTSIRLQDNSVIIGQIDFLFQHCFDTNIETYEFVHWLGIGACILRPINFYNFH